MSRSEIKARLALINAELKKYQGEIPPYRKLYLKDLLHRKKRIQQKLQSFGQKNGRKQVPDPRHTHFYHRLLTNTGDSKKEVTPAFKSKDQCQFCNINLRINIESSKSVCVNCGYTQDVISLQKEYEPVLAYRNRTVYRRAPQYLTYLMQFHESAPPIPKEVIQVLYKGLSHIHIMLPEKIKRTPVIKILRQNGMSHLTDMAIKIVKILRGEPVPKFSQELIDRLHHRFKALCDERKEGRKVPNVEFLTKEFLKQEGELELLGYFKVHKTRKVLRNATRQLKSLY
jgi:hypothetical protein